MLWERRYKVSRRFQHNKRGIMPPKTKFTLKNVMDAALSVVRRYGIGKLTARAIADELQSSTMPIYSCGKTMSEIEEEIVRNSWDLLVEYQQKPITSDPYINMGLGYVLFATHEKNLFECIHSQKFRDTNKKLAEKNMFENILRLKDYPPLADISFDLKLKIMIQGWIFSHGLADLIAKNIGDMIGDINTDDALQSFFNEANRIFFVGVQKIIEESMGQESN